MRAELVLLLIAGVDQRKTFQEEHGKDARHQVQQQPAEKRKADDAGKGRERK